MGNNLIISGQGESGQKHPGWERENREPFLQCCYTVSRYINSEIIVSDLTEGSFLRD
jgi:hypothetical protein